MSFVGDWISELYEETIGRITGEKQYKKAVKKSGEVINRQLALQEALLEELRGYLPPAIEQLALGYGLARRSLNKSLGRAMAQMEMQRDIMNQMLGQGTKLGFMSKGAVEAINQAVAREFANALMSAVTEIAGKEAQLFADEAVKRSLLPVEYLRGATGILGASPDLMGYANLFKARPPSLFDRLFQFGTIWALKGG